MGFLNFFKAKPAPTVLTTRYSNVLGCDYKNGDGSSRQAAIKTLRQGDPLFFKPAPTREYPDSIGVFTKSGKQIGVIAYPLLNELRNNFPITKLLLLQIKLSKAKEDFL